MSSGDGRISAETHSPLMQGEPLFTMLVFHGNRYKAIAPLMADRRFSVVVVPGNPQAFVYLRTFL